MLVIQSFTSFSAPSGGHPPPHQILGTEGTIVDLLGTILFLIGAGLYAGLCCRTTTAAVAWLFGVYLVLILPAGLLPAGEPGLLSPESGGQMLRSPVSLLVIGCVSGGLGLLALRESIRCLRCNVFG